MTHFTNTDSVIDSRDIIERIEELEIIKDDLLLDNPSGATVALWLQGDVGQEYTTLKELAEECEQYASDWTYGEQLIHRDYFEAYMDEMIEDCYELPQDLPYWMSIKLDYDALEQDYTSVDFDGEEYLIRCV